MMNIDRIVLHKKNRAPQSSVSVIVLLLFWITILFQLTVIKYIWPIDFFAKIANFLSLIILSFFACKSIFLGRFRIKLWIFYILPGLFVYFGLLQNISYNVILNFKLISYLGQIIPWAAYLTIPYFLQKNFKNEILWKHYYYFMLIVISLGLIEYFLVFSGLSYFRKLETPNGVFLGGVFSLLHMMDDGSPYFRFYSCFAEPGTLAMFLLPSIAYSFFYKNIIALAVFLIAFFLTGSLGGLISLIILAVVIISISTITARKKTNILILVFTVILSTTLMWLSFGDYIKSAYHEKNNSRIIREDNLRNLISNIPQIFMNAPFGYKLAVDTESAQKNELYFGSNFTPGNMLVFGGISAFIGYILCLILSFVVAVISLQKNKNLTLEDKVVFSSIIALLPFIVQRTVVWDNAIFAFLFAPSLIRSLYLKRARLIYHKNEIDFNLSKNYGA